MVRGADWLLRIRMNVAAEDEPYRFELSSKIVTDFIATNNHVGQFIASTT